MNLFSAIVKAVLASTSLIAAAALLAATPVAGAHFQTKPNAQPTTGTTAPAAGTPAAVPPPAADKPPLKQEELDQLLAPLALYPDSLLSQILMASTYPLEVVEADRYAKANPKLTGDALAKELEKQPWDPSVKSLVNFPQVLAMMSDNLAETVKIGDAFIGQQKQVMDTVQALRAKAQSSGNLKTTPEQTVKVEAAPAGSTTTQVIVIEPAKPDVIYVPQYNPTVVYGAWPYPAYPPYPYYPPGYVASNVLSFGLGVACGVAWGYAWGNCNWGRGDVNINVNQNNNFNRNINRSNYQNNFNGGGNGNWKHDPSHRQGVAYRDQASANKVGASNNMNKASQSRDAYRGKANAGAQDLNRGGADNFKGNNPGGGANRPGNNPSAGAGAANRPANNATGGAGAGTRPANTSGTNKGSAFSGAGNSGASTREASNRGASSRSASPSSTSRSAPARSSGGASRGGGGGGRGGGGRR
ncbi:MAG: DUF3300 domain-containing protein [Phycisphaerales bacterium]